MSDGPGNKPDPTTLDGIYDDLYGVLIAVGDVGMVLADVERRVVRLMEKIQKLSDGSHP